MSQLDFNAIVEDAKTREAVQKKVSANGGTQIDYTSEPHVACCLLVDTSSSMSANGKIDELNRALSAFRSEVCEDVLSARRVDVCVIEFNSCVEIVTPFCPISSFQAPVLKARGTTSMGAGIRYALEAVHEQVSKYHRLGVECYKPFVLMITDGVPTDNITGIGELIKSREDAGKYGHLRFHAFGVKGADFDVLTSLCHRVAAVDDNAFMQVFNWASKSMQVISRSRTNDNPAPPYLPPQIVGIDPNGSHKPPWED